MIFTDTETCGFYGPIVLWQYAKDDGPIELYEPWDNQIDSTIDLMEWFCYHSGGICGFNLVFDMFHMCQMVTTLIEMRKTISGKEILGDHMAEYVEAEHKASRTGPCIKVHSCLDLMLHARKGPYQSTMNRGDITIKRIPWPLAEKLREYLDTNIPLKDIYFCNKTNPKERWTVVPIKDDFDDVDREFCNLRLRFSPSSALKALAMDALKLDDVFLYEDIGVHKALTPEEYGYAPFAKAAYNKPWKDPKTPYPWPRRIDFHRRHWKYNERARKYAANDVDYLRQLYTYFGNPPVNDNDSVLACMAAAVRWHGFTVNLDKMKELKEQAQKSVEVANVKFSSGAACKEYLYEVMAPQERIILQLDGKATTKGVILEAVTRMTVAKICEHCQGMSFDCTHCTNGIIETKEPHPAAVRAQEILDLRHAKKEIELYDKFLHAGAFHISLNPIGTLSSRMSGGDGLNAQGIKRAERVRSCFPFVDADSDYVLCGGDFEGFEITIMDAVYHDTKMHSELISDKKIHAIWGSKYFFPEMSYQQIIETKGLPGEEDKYSRSKNGVFCVCYFGEGYSLTNRVGIPTEVAEQAYQKILKDYPEFAERRRFIIDKFCSMKQPDGIGSKVIWAEPEEYIESLLHFRRYFTIENQIVKALFNLANDLPEDWRAIEGKVRRRDRMQTVAGAVCSALYAAAFNVQASNMRAAGNHVIQSTGADLTKGLQVALWQLQPIGINEWNVIPFQVHDEVLAAVKKDYQEKTKEVVKNYIQENRKLIPLLDMKWKTNIATWADK